MASDEWALQLPNGVCVGGQLGFQWVTQDAPLAHRHLRREADA
jgi:hypothetical protein